MEEKKIFLEPKLDILQFPKQDIVTTSDGGGGGIVLPDDEWK